MTNPPLQKQEKCCKKCDHGYHCELSYKCECHSQDSAKGWELKEEIKNFRKNHNDVRFGQWLWNLMNKHGYWEAPEANALFFIEDEELAKLLEE